MTPQIFRLPGVAADQYPEKAPECRDILAADISGLMRANFWAKVQKGANCWVWTGAHTKGGYANFGTNKRTFRASRVMYAIQHRCCPGNRQVLHSCDNPSCVNPDHLSLGTNQDNINDMLSKGRQVHQRKTHCIHGHELTEENIYRKPDNKNWRCCRKCRAISHRKSYERSKSK